MSGECQCRERVQVEMRELPRVGVYGVFYIFLRVSVCVCLFLCVSVCVSTCLCASLWEPCASLSFFVSLFFFFLSPPPYPLSLPSIPFSPRYDRASIQAWFDRGKKTSPLTGKTLESTTLIPNHRLRSVIEGRKQKTVKRHK